ncbi:hypothetical protein FGIG_08843 [Fasciola gigantica]|uniref:PH domain-containing protein n=1 Tax=Fasciola gigantica TaxID=46835 RepID=A0A504YKI8_FASGI|nr:hypothetical protein FGIG_08843 [Fasciola gigantica]
MIDSPGYVFTRGCSKTISVSSSGITQVLMEGLLTKSPPSQDNSSHSGNFLRDVGLNLDSSNIEIAAPLYGVYPSIYEEGRVDLRNCECIVDNVEIGKWSNVFSIQTMHKDRSRVYYFAAETQELMAKWVNSLVVVTRFRRDPVNDIGFSTVKSMQSVSTRVAPFARTPLGVPPPLAPLPTPTTPVNNTWLHGAGDASLEAQLMDNYPLHGDDSYNDPGAPEVQWSGM